MLCDLACQKSQHRQQGKVGGQVFFAVAVIVLQVVALVFEGVERFVLDFPTRTCYGYHFLYIILAYGQIGDPTTVVKHFAGLRIGFGIFQVIDFQFLVRNVRL